MNSINLYTANIQEQICKNANFGWLCIKSQNVIPFLTQGLYFVLIKYSQLLAKC